MSGLDHIRNREILDACDNIEAFTPPERKTPKEAIAHALLVVSRKDWRLDALSEWDTEHLAEASIKALKAAGYDIVQRVSEGNTPFVRP